MRTGKITIEEEFHQSIVQAAEDIRNKYIYGIFKRMREDWIQGLKHAF